MEVYYIPPPEPELPIKVETRPRSEPTSLKGSTHSVIVPVHGTIPRVHGHMPGTSGSATSLHASTSGSGQGSPLGTSPKSSDENVLIDVERNIASLEQAIRTKETTVDIEYLEESRAQKLKTAGKRFLK